MADSDARPPRVLICDDAEYVREALREMLQHAGFTVVGEAEDGVVAVERYAETRPDVVTMDLVMPRRSGLDAAELILAADPAARIVLCTALDQPGLREHLLGRGVRGVLVKPFTEGQLVAEIRRILGDDPTPS